MTINKNDIYNKLDELEYVTIKDYIHDIMIIFYKYLDSLRDDVTFLNLKDFIISARDFKINNHSAIEGLERQYYKVLKNAHKEEKNEQICLINNILIMVKNGIEHLNDVLIHKK